MPILSELAQRKKLDYFFADVPKHARILDVGCGAGWMRRELERRGFGYYVGLDLTPPADLVGDVRDWHTLGIQPSSFDVITAFEVVEHVDCFVPLYAMLREGGLLFLTSPVPHMDWLCKLLESIGLNQKRTSPHDHLTYFDSVRLFEPMEVKTVGLMAQWGKFRKPCVARPLISVFEPSPAIEDRVACA